MSPQARQRRSSPGSDDLCTAAGETRPLSLWDPVAGPAACKLRGVFSAFAGLGGAGVWKVERAGDGIVEVQEAVRDARPSRMPLEAFVARCEPYFPGEGRMVEQPFQTRLADGMRH